MRIPERGSPSNVSTTSTACSRVLGPATSPSLVTWPVITTATPLALANPTRASAHPRTCDGPPIASPVVPSRSVWMESTARRNGRASDAAARTSFSSRPATNCSASAPSPSRRARIATCSRDSSPEASRHRRPADSSEASSCRSNVDFPIPGSPARRATVAETSPPPSTRSMPAIPVEIRSPGGAAAPPGPPSVATRALPDGGDGWTTRSATEPHAPHPGHRPAHWASCCPHLEQVKTDRVLATRRR
jgi:hypothetical protein